jgi:putative endonuclease
MTTKQEVGRSGEDLAAAWYEANGYRVLDRNWRTRHGEIDIVAGRGDVVVFCEVKTRTTTRFGRGFDAVGRAKQQRIRRLAVNWLQQSPQRFGQIRFDVVDVDGAGNVEVLEACF